jgi:hypothetical protein
MQNNCLLFFQTKFPDDDKLQLSMVSDRIDRVQFTIENPGKTKFGHTCITLIIYKDLSLMKIDLVNKCTLTGTQNVLTALEFAKSMLIKQVELVDASAILYVVSTEDIEISLKQTSMLIKGYTWYETYGFRNGFDVYREWWITYIHHSFDYLYDRLKKFPEIKDITILINEHKGYNRNLKKYTDTGNINEMFKNIITFLKKNCPPVVDKDKEINKCNVSITDHDFVFLSGFVSKSFELIMWAVHLEKGKMLTSYAQLKAQMQLYDTYSLLLFLPIQSLITIHGLNDLNSLNGSIGKIVDITPTQYRVTFPKSTQLINRENVKLVDKVILHGLTDTSMNNSQGVIVSTTPDRFVIELDAPRDIHKRRSVKFENVKGIGGKSRRKSRRKCVKKHR